MKLVLSPTYMHITLIFAYCNKSHGFVHQNILCRIKISAKGVNSRSLMVSTAFFNVLKPAIFPSYDVMKNKKKYFILLASFLSTKIEFRISQR
jgi:hypothetical protein